MTTSSIFFERLLTRNTVGGLEFVLLSPIYDLAYAHVFPSSPLFHTHSAIDGESRFALDELVTPQHSCTISP